MESCKYNFYTYISVRSYVQFFDPGGEETRDPIFNFLARYEYVKYYKLKMLISSLKI